MQKNMLKKTLVIGLITLFIVASVAPIISSIGEAFKDIEAFETLNQGGVSNLFLSKKSSLVGVYLGEEEIRYYNPDTLTPLVTLGCPHPPCYWTSAIRLTQDEFAAYAGWDIIAVKVAHSAEEEPEHWGEIEIYGEGTPTSPGALITTEPYYFDATGWFRVDLTTPVPIDDHNEIWVACTWETWNPDHCAYVDGGPAVHEKGDWVSWGDGADWEELGNCNWAIGAIVEGEKAELSIVNIKGPIGVNAEAKNIGEVPACNVEYTMTVTGGILGGINRTVSGNKTKLAVHETEPISSGFLLGFGPISITVTADAVNAYEVSTSKSGFIIGPFVFGIN